MINSGLELAAGFLAIAVLLFLSGLISGSEVAFFSLTPNDYEEIQDMDNSSSKLLLELKEKPRRLLATILIANNFINIAIVLISEWLLKTLLPDELTQDWGRALIELFSLEGSVDQEILATVLRFSITVIGVTFLLVLFGEVAPKVYARYNKVPLALRMSRPLNLMMGFFRPLTFTLVNGAAVIERRLENHTQDIVAASQQDIDEAIDLTVKLQESGEEGQRQDVDILKRIVQFANVTVRQIMRSRGDVIAVEKNIDYHALLAIIRENNYSRLPVYEEDFDKIRGLLYVKDLLGHRNEGPEFDWFQLVREDVLYIPENKRISELLKEFQQEKMHLAIVVDEYGGTEGIVTLEDVLEEVIGDIQDEFDEDDEIIYEQIDDLNFIFEGKTLLKDVCRILDLPTSTFDEAKGDAESFAGLLLELLGQFPVAEQELEFRDFRFKIVSITHRRIEEILITLPSKEE
ncbi:gliding motility-associated protein GldE [Neolewinella lacunae]|uniref:Gliding motility-associated protein GldE n=1 Tax=Neolewinella lacunae TaxID=1517758 RepID=A0A923T6N2_9BACT|nr:gliding motility-associated protein GldE [Neolewinella lacunae]MBC6992771.1 gliding motility-associated protein GldE [Neolewinella lacunae]MDN3636015.1 gliding motility-associated protein GldE [Neolewinella lacunae]